MEGRASRPSGGPGRPPLHATAESFLAAPRIQWL